jgi:hypothetical protein
VAATAKQPMPLTRFLEAGRGCDFAKLHGLIDWGLSTACVIVSALAGIKDRDRETVARAGLADIDQAARSVDRARKTMLTELSKFVNQVTVVRKATADEASWALREGVVVPPAPSGLSPGTAARLDIHRARAARVAEVWVAERAAGPGIWLAITPERDRVVLVSKL